MLRVEVLARYRSNWMIKTMLNGISAQSSSRCVPALEEAFVQAKSGIRTRICGTAVDLLYDESIVRDWYRAKTDKDPKFSDIVAKCIKWHLIVFWWLTFFSRPNPTQWFMFRYYKAF